MDHDQRFKTLLMEFFKEFLALFFPAWVDRFDLTRVEWLLTEAFLDPPEGERRNLDLVAKLPVRQEVMIGGVSSCIALVHVEIESRDAAAPLRPRMPEYYWFLRTRHDLPVLPIALFLNVGLDGIGWDVYEEWFWEHRLVHFEYAYIGLPALDAETYLNGQNVLGVALAALMRIPEEKRSWLKAESMRRLAACAENEQRRFLLFKFVDDYLPLEGVNSESYDHLMRTEPYREAFTMGTTFEQRGFERGLKTGVRRVLQAQLEKKFGPLSPGVVNKLDAWPTDRLEEVGARLLEARSLEELGLEEDRPA